MARVSEAVVAPLFLSRWSSRAFSPDSLQPGELASLFEAARWAPSASNSQPWLFIYADGDPELSSFRELLRDSNRRWADRAPALAFVFASKQKEDGTPNRSALFDAGAAWMSLALQAHVLGLNVRAMGGIHRERVFEVLSVPVDQYELGCGIAIGRPGDAAALPVDLRERERPNTRKPAASVALRGRFSGL
jgi:nitroreductase